jgi:hypothetical protein
MPDSKEKQCHVLLYPAFDAYYFSISLTLFFSLFSYEIGLGECLKSLRPKDDDNTLFLFSPRDYERVSNDTVTHLRDNKKQGKLHPLTLTTRHGHGVTTHEHFITMARETNSAFVEVPTEETVFSDPSKYKNAKVIKFVFAFFYFLSTNYY